MGVACAAEVVDVSSVAVVTAGEPEDGVDERVSCGCRVQSAANSGGTCSCGGMMRVSGAGGPIIVLVVSTASWCACKAGWSDES